MKKIIYSLVIMIAAGSLFTSCIAQTELEDSYKKMRDEKAAYIDAMRTLMRESLAAEKGLTEALANKAQAEADYIDAQKALLDAVTDAQRREAEAKADLAEAEAKIAKAKADQIEEELLEKAKFMSPAMQKAYISAALAYFGAKEAAYALQVKSEADPSNKVLADSYAAAVKAEKEAYTYWKQVEEKVKKAYKDDEWEYIDPTEAIEDLLGALPDDMKSAIMDKIMKALASIVD